MSEGYHSWGFPVGAGVKNLPAVQETWVGPLGGEDPVEEGMAAHSSIPAWKIPWTEEPGGLRSTGPQSQTRLSDRARTHTHTHTHTHTLTGSPKLEEQTPPTI